MSSDLFAVRDWTGSLVSVQGYYVGMSYEEARANSSTRRLSLANPDLDTKPCRVPGLCVVSDQASGLTTSVILEIGSSSKITTIYVTKFQEDSDPQFRKSVAHWSFKGATYDLFARYSGDLRQKLLGREDAKETSERYRTQTFRYSKRGLMLQKSACSGMPVESGCGDLTLAFTAPTTQRPQ